MLSSLTILGLRGFADKQSVEFAKPTGELGSGLTMIVGANNSGKSTAIEALRALTQHTPPSFTQGRRNQLAGDRVELTLVDESGGEVKVESQFAGTSETHRIPQDSTVGRRNGELFVLPSRRVFSPYFGRGRSSRVDYSNQTGFPVLRSATIDEFTNRLFTIQNNRADFDAVMKKVLDPAPDWSIDQTDTGQHYLKIKRGDAFHSSEGLGEGLVSLIYIIDALYDSEPGQMIAIDEPELSLHPALQRKLAALLAEYASDRQIVCSTHSPYFVNVGALLNGAIISRVHLVDGVSTVSTLSAETGKNVARFVNDANNPHVLGLNAQEAFFLDDRIVLVEGQEDVVFFSRVENSIGIKLRGEYFGWGVGGAEKMKLIAQLLQELGFKRVVGALDGNKGELVNDLRLEFPSFHFFAIPADDVRNKPPVKARDAVVGLLNRENDKVRDEHKAETARLFQAANAYLAGTQRSASDTNIEGPIAPTGSR